MVHRHERSILAARKQNPSYKKKQNAQLGLFSKSKYKKYEEIVSLKSVDEAKESIDTLIKEFNSAETRTKKLRVARVIQRAANMARVISRKKDLSPKERKKFVRISRKYRFAARKAWKAYRTKTPIKTKR